MRWSLLVLVACGAPQPATHRPPRACVALADAQMEEQSARDRGRQSLTDAIAARGLTLVTLPAKSVDVGEHSNEWRVDGARVLAPIGMQGCGPLPEGGDFVRDATGQLWALLPAPVAKSQRTVASCSCRSELSAGGLHCGGAAPPPLQLAYDLPAGATFRGTLIVQYDMEVVSISYADDDPGSRCPPMPPPPA